MRRKRLLGEKGTLGFTQVTVSNGFTMAVCHLRKKILFVGTSIPGKYDPMDLLLTIIFQRITQASTSFTRYLGVLKLH